MTDFAETAEKTISGHIASPGNDYIRWFEEISKWDVSIAGGKGANLGELTRAGVSVPPGFVVTAKGFTEFLEVTRLKGIIRDRIARINVDNANELELASQELRASVLSAEIPVAIKDAVKASHDRLTDIVGESDLFVAVRSSATAEDTAETSFAGMNETFLNVKGADSVVESVKKCWASLYGSRVLFYINKQNVSPERLSIAVIVQAMVDADRAGVMFTIDPVSGSTDTIVIEASFGLGDAVVSGSVNPDHFEVDKHTLDIKKKTISSKAFMDLRGPDGGVIRQELSIEKANSASLSDEEIHELARQGKQIENHYGSPQDIEWAIQKGSIYILQTRPVTAVGRKEQPRGITKERQIIARGLGASPGIAVGRARVLAGIEESDRFRPGDILVTRMTAPDWVPLMRKAAAIVTDEGGSTAHAAIVSRELGIPCIVGTSDATKCIPDGAIITVDAREGMVYEGEVEEVTRQVSLPQYPALQVPQAQVTGTKLYVNLGEPNMAQEVAAMPVDGVGLLRAEFMILSITNNVHPRKLMQEGRSNELADKLADGLRTFGEAFNPRPVIYRATDFRSNEYRNMGGGIDFEPTEANPMIGYRGAYRYVNEPDLFQLELRALKKARTEYRLENIHLMIPFARTLWEMEEVVDLVSSAGLLSKKPGSMELWVMAEVPSAVYRLEDYAALGITGVSIGSNDLTQLVLGVDRDSEKVAPLFDERDKAVMETMREIIQQCHGLGLTSSICGQAPSIYPEITEKLVEWGVTSVSVNPDVALLTRAIIASAEQKVLLDATQRRTRPDTAQDTGHKHTSIH
ncbi:MAG: phosphoenolpyruvate synthase [Armatimonadetes bacterium]|nr:phosphoenolpyruvate synthase [Armatimonadota bacterium]